VASPDLGAILPEIFGSHNLCTQDIEKRLATPARRTARLTWNAAPAPPPAARSRDKLLHSLFVQLVLSFGVYMGHRQHGF
jgi:hypothetical protein